MELNKNELIVLYNLMNIPFIKIKHYVHAIGMDEYDYKDFELFEKIEQELEK